MPHEHISSRNHEAMAECKKTESSHFVLSWQKDVIKKMYIYAEYPKMERIAC